MHAVDLLRQERLLMARLVDSLSASQLTQIPDGHRNNILWNLGHVVVTQQRLHYRISDLEMYITSEMENACRSGTSPADWGETPDFATLRRWLEELPGRLQEDYDAGSFGGFREYTTSTGIRLRTIEEAIVFNQYHEGVHMGVMMGLRKLVAN
jgi:hypothetical protein